MAHASVSYGTETPETIDRFGTTQEYSVFVANGPQTDLYRLVPTRTDAVIARLGLAVVSWTWSKFHGSHTYKLDVHGRRLAILHSADGRIKLTLDGRDVYKERKRYRRTQDGPVAEVVAEYDQEQVREQREEDKRARLDAVRARLEKARTRLTP